MASSPQKYQRNTYLIDKGFQLKYALLLGAAGAVATLLFGGMVYLAMGDAFRYVPSDSPFALQVREARLTLLWLTGGTCVFLGATLALFGVYLTHRVAGPVYVMNHYLSVIGSGKYPRMRPLRKNDELKTFFQGLQTTVEFLRTREQREAAVLEETLQALSTSAPVPREVLDRLTQLKEQKMLVAKDTPKA